MFDKKKMLYYANWGVVVFALLSAFFWFVASQDNPAAKIIDVMDLQTKTDAFGNNLASVAHTLIDQRRLNMHAARCAGLSALSQGFAFAFRQILEK